MIALALAVAVVAVVASRRSSAAAAPSAAESSPAAPPGAITVPTLPPSYLPPPPPLYAEPPPIQAPELPGGAGDVLQVLGGAAAGAGVGGLFAEVTDANAVVGGGAILGGAIAGGTIAAVGAVAAAPVVAVVAAVVGTARLVQDLYELSTGRQEAIDNLRRLLDEAYASGGQAARDALQAELRAENARRYLAEMAEPRALWAQDDVTHLRYRVDRGKLIGDAYGGEGQLEYDGLIFDWRTGSPAPIGKVPPVVNTFYTTAPMGEAVLAGRQAAAGARKDLGNE